MERPPSGEEMKVTYYPEDSKDIDGYNRASESKREREMNPWPDIE